MKIKKIPMRKCLVSKESFPKKELIRIVVDKEKNVSVDQSGKLNGRGAYLKLDLAIIKEAKKRKVLEREFEVSNLEHIYQELEDLASA